VDWSHSRVIFISPEYTSYQRKAVEFKDLPIELWEVKRYFNSIILFNNKSESITKISRNGVVNRVSKEVHVYTEEYHLNYPMQSHRSTRN
jgi:hypothetical protein